MERVYVVGGGPAGLAAAIACRRAHFDVTLVEASNFGRYRAGEHLVAQGVQQLRELGVPDKVWRDFAHPCDFVSSMWGDAESRRTEAIYNPYGEGIILSRPAFDRALATFARGLGVQIVTGAKCVAVRQQELSLRVDIVHQGKTQSCMADYAIDASGRAAVLARRCGARKIRYDSLVGMVRLQDISSQDDPVSGHITIEALENGWLYAASLADGPIVTTAFTDADFMRTFQSPADAERYFLSRSREAGRHVPAVDGSSEIKVFPAHSQTLSRITGRRWLAVGDSAWSADPLSSQGLLKAISMGLSAADVLALDRAGDTTALSRFEQSVRLDFRRYLEERSAVYLQEKRWSEKPFWRGRHRSTSPKGDILLHPSHRMTPYRGEPGDLRRQLEATAPLVDSCLLHAILAESPLAAEAVGRYQAASRGLVEDREVIMALQTLEGIQASGPS